MTLALIFFLEFNDRVIYRSLVAIHSQILRARYETDSLTLQRPRKNEL